MANTKKAMKKNKKFRKKIISFKRNGELDNIKSYIIGVLAYCHNKVGKGKKQISVQRD